MIFVLIGIFWLIELVPNHLSLTNIDLSSLSVKFYCIPIIIVFPSIIGTCSVQSRHVRSRYLIRVIANCRIVENVNSSSALFWFASWKLQYARKVL